MILKTLMMKGLHIFIHLSSFNTYKIRVMGMQYIMSVFVFPSGIIFFLYIFLFFLLSKQSKVSLFLQL